MFWGWDSGNSMKEILADFEKANPGITVKFNNTGTAEKTSTALSNAIAAGNGAPDVVMLEDPTVTQFAVTDGLVDLSEFGADKLADDFAAGPWNKLQYNNKPYALPIDSGPEMFFYNKAVFDKAGVDGESIKTWNDYYEAAKKIRATGSYITNLAGTSNDYQPFTAQIWQAGAQPWKVDGENITINMTKDEGMQRYIQFVQKLIDEDLVDAKTPNWSDDWNRELNDGTLASLTIGAWMPINLMTGAPDQAGNWRVAQLPQWEEGKEVSAEDGGSALAVTSQSKNQAAAYKLVEYMTHGEGAQTMADTGTFPSLKKILRSDSFTDPTTESNKKTTTTSAVRTSTKSFPPRLSARPRSSSTCRTTRTPRPLTATKSPRPTPATSPWRKRLKTMPTSSPSKASSRATTSPSSDATDLLPVHPALTNNQNLRLGHSPSA